MKGAPFSSAVLVTCLLAAACGGRQQTKEDVTKALQQANLPHVAVDVDHDAQIVHLKGTVGTMSDRTRAEEVAAAAVGTTGRVLNELTVEGLNTDTADDFDDDIRDTLDRMLDNDSVLKERDVNFEVANGVVTITGEVRSAQEKNRVSQIVKAAPGVKDFANALEIHPEQ
jgi:hyperosmotically inducible periplasmic protein